MALSFDILDHIFAFLRSDRRSLIACSDAHPDLSSIAERHRYYHTIVHSGFTSFSYSLRPARLLEIVSETPRIVSHVRVLQVEFRGSQSRDLVTLVASEPYLEDIALLLPKFHRLECFMLSTERENMNLSWQTLPQSFRTAVGDCLRLPTLQEVHIGELDFPVSLLDHGPNINMFSLAGKPQSPESHHGDPGPPLKILSVRSADEPFVTWAKRCIGSLQSLECPDSPCILDLLEGCSHTLQFLDIGIWSHTDRSTLYNLYDSDSDDSEVDEHGVPHSISLDHILGIEDETQIPIDLSSLRQLQTLTVRSMMYFDEVDITCVSYLPAVVKMLQTVSIPLQRLNIDIYVELKSTDIALDFLPLTDLAESCASFHHIEFCISSGSRRFFHTLHNHPGLRRLIDRGTLVVKEENTTPLFFEIVHSRSLEALV